MSHDSKSCPVLSIIKTSTIEKALTGDPDAFEELARAFKIPIKEVEEILQVKMANKNKKLI